MLTIPGRKQAIDWESGKNQTRLSERAIHIVVRYADRVNFFKKESDTVWEHSQRMPK